MRHNAEPIFVNEFEQFKYELNNALWWIAKRMAEAMRPDIEVAMNRIGLTLKRHDM